MGIDLVAGADPRPFDRHNSRRTITTNSTTNHHKKHHFRHFAMQLCWNWCLVHVSNWLKVFGYKRHSLAQAFPRGSIAQKLICGGKLTSIWSCVDQS